MTGTRLPVILIIVRASAVASSSGSYSSTAHAPACIHPVKLARRLERVATFAREKITQTELGRVFVHKKPRLTKRARLEGAGKGKTILLLSDWFLELCILWVFADAPSSRPTGGSETRTENFHSGQQS